MHKNEPRYHDEAQLQLYKKEEARKKLGTQKKDVGGLLTAFADVAVQDVTFGNDDGFFTHMKKVDNEQDWRDFSKWMVDKPDYPYLSYVVYKVKLSSCKRSMIHAKFLCEYVSCG